ncbi:hypothetical protein EE612_012745 [Oryza sativa]|nr:hypothetical protein EE612_012745 [Oryza sativa]
MAATTPAAAAAAAHVVHIEAVQTAVPTRVVEPGRASSPWRRRRSRRPRCSAASARCSTTAAPAGRRRARGRTGCG